MNDQGRVRLEESLAGLHQRDTAVLTGSGTAALALSLRALGLSGKGVALPNGVCPNVPAAAQLAGCRPVFVDPAPDTLGLSAAALSACREVFSAVLAVHAYGTPCDIEGVARFCNAKGLPLIEDCAVAQGVSCAGKPAGSFGDVSIVSFGAGKVIAHGVGGAVLTDDRALARELARLDSALPEPAVSSPDSAHFLALAFKDAYNASMGGDESGRRRWTRTSAALAPALLHRFARSWREPIGDRLAKLAELVAERRRKARLLSDKLQGIDGVEVLRGPEGAVPWRFNILVARGRNELLRRLWERGLKASSWYGPIDLFYREASERASPMPVSDAFGARAVNLWVNEEIDERYIDAATAIVKEFRTQAIAEG